MKNSEKLTIKGQVKQISQFSRIIEKLTNYKIAKNNLNFESEQTDILREQVKIQQSELEVAKGELAISESNKKLTRAIVLLSFLQIFGIGYTIYISYEQIILSRAQVKLTSDWLKNSSIQLTQDQKNNFETNSPYLELDTTTKHNMDFDTFLKSLSAEEALEISTNYEDVLMHSSTFQITNIGTGAATKINAMAVTPNIKDIKTHDLAGTLSTNHKEFTTNFNKDERISSLVEKDKNILLSTSNNSMARINILLPSTSKPIWDNTARFLFNTKETQNSDPKSAKRPKLWPDKDKLQIASHYESKLGLSNFIPVLFYCDKTSNCYVSLAKHPQVRRRTLYPDLRYSSKLSDRLDLYRVVKLSEEGLSEIFENFNEERLVRKNEKINNLLYSNILLLLNFKSSTPLNDKAYRNYHRYFDKLPNGYTADFCLMSKGARLFEIYEPKLTHDFIMDVASITIDNIYKDYSLLKDEVFLDITNSIRILHSYIDSISETYEYSVEEDRCYQSEKNYFLNNKNEQESWNEELKSINEKLWAANKQFKNDIPKLRSQLDNLNQQNKANYKELNKNIN